MKEKRVICAMSGGVDSSVAAAILKQQGYDVIGIFMKFWSEKVDKTDLVRENVCCSLEAATAARAVANKLNIPFYVINLEDEFKKAVVDYYIKEYEEGRTPNPCVICNRDIKGEILMKKISELDADFLATGHYARVKSEIINPKFETTSELQNSNDKKYRYCLYRGIDNSKDQTYFLWTLTQEKLSKLLFPLGEMTKPEVRQLASKLKLPTAERRESQGLCFIPDRDVCGFLSRYAKKGNIPGKIVDINGNILGTHNGLINYTIGQRERLGLGGPKAYFVVKLESTENILVVGDPGDLYSKQLVAKNVNWIKKTNNNKPTTSSAIEATIRYGHPAEKCRIDIEGDMARVEFKEPQRAITPGQSIVFYKGDEVLGGAVIEKSGT